MPENPSEIPQALRDVAEQNMKQAHAAYEQLTDFVTKAMDAWMGAMPSPMAAGFKDVQGRAMQIAKENAESVFTFAGKISNVRTPQDIVTLETQFAQDRMQALVTQTQQLLGVIEETIQKWERGAMGAEMSAMPSNLMTAGFKDVRGRAMDIAMEISRVGLHVRRQDQQRTDLPRYCDASDAIRSRPDAGLRHADAAALQADRGNCPEAATRLIFPRRQTILMARQLQTIRVRLSRASPVPRFRTGLSSRPYQLPPSHPPCAHAKPKFAFSSSPALFL